MRKPTRKSRLRFLWLTVGLAIVAMISATTGALLAVSLSGASLSQRELSPEDEAFFNAEEEEIARMGLQLPQLTRPVNILVLGVKVLTSDLDEESSRDYGYHALVNSFEGLSDTMLLVRFDPNAGKLTALSIPRDTRTRVDGLGVTKINEANRQGGPALSARTASELLNGVGIDRYVRINVQGVEKLVDALGGVTLYVPKDMKYQDDSQHLYINLEEGRQQLDGEKALQFLRFRYDEYGDIGRVQRQQMMMRAIKEQALNPATILRLPKVLSVVRENLDTNLSLEEIAALMGFATRVDREDVQMLILPGDFGDPGSYGGVSYWVPNHREIGQMVAQYFDVGLEDRVSNLDNWARTRIAIQDSTDEPGAARDLARYLGSAGFRNAFVARDWHEMLDTTRIIAQNGDLETARQVQAALGFGEVRVDGTGDLGSDITVQIGRDWLARQDTALEEAESFGR